MRKLLRMAGSGVAIKLVLPLPSGAALLARARFLLLGLALLGGAGAAQASPYYWVPTGTGAAASGNGVWNELAHWAASSGGPGGAYSQVPQSTDDVYFDANSFTGNNQRVDLNFSGTGQVGATPTCRNLTWSGNVRGATFSAATKPTLEINGDIQYTPLMGSPANVDYRLLAAGAGHVIDMQNIYLANSTFTLANALGEWTFTSPVNMAPNSSQINLQAAARVSLGRLIRSAMELSRDISFISRSSSLRWPRKRRVQSADCRPRRFSNRTFSGI